MAGHVRAAVLRACGTPPEPGDVELPARGPDLALVAVTAAPITPLDVLCATGTSYFGAPATPYVPGVQGVGTVVESAAHPAGTRVWFPTDAGMAPGDGSMAERCLAPDADLMPLPDGVDDEQVAALGLSAVAAWGALTRAARLEPGEQVLVLGGGGIVGQVAIQAARLLGARRVVAAARSEAARRRAAAAGPDAVVPIEPGEDAATLAERLREACDGGVDVVVDPLFGVPASAASTLLAPHGRLVNLGGSAGDTATFRSSVLRSKPASVLGYTNNDVPVAEKREILAEVLRHAAAGRIGVEFETVPLADVAAAWAAQADGSTSARVVLRP
jgi:NADPH:quinone reductase-like Zn-dependent oxidoreductase